VRNGGGIIHLAGALTVGAKTDTKRQGFSSEKIFPSY